MRLQILVKTGLLKVRQLPLLPRLIYIASYSVTFAILLGINYIWFVLLSQIVRREGLVLLWHEEMLPSLVTLSSKGPIQVNFKFLLIFMFALFYFYTLFFMIRNYIQAELVSMMLRWLSEDITVHNEDLEGLWSLKFYHISVAAACKLPSRCWTYEL
jgi:hypothetical protein